MELFTGNATVNDGLILRQVGFMDRLRLVHSARSTTANEDFSAMRLSSLRDNRYTSFLAIRLTPETRILAYLSLYQRGGGASF
ncbi:hypothetical protein [Pseudomonas sp. NGC7]|uniref:hypothetical protein n=1 Tax=Pseudomonas sp. NGC7 TaxID=3341775 RepID=UPI0037DB6E01